MPTVKKTQIKLYLDDGKTAVINLPAPINDDLIDEDEGTSLINEPWLALKDAYASDDGATVTAADFNIITTTTSVIAKNFKGA